MSCDTRPCGDDGAVPNQQRFARTAVDDCRPRTNVDVIADMDIAGNMNPWRKRYIVTDLDVVTNGTVQIYVNMRTDADVNG